MSVSIINIKRKSNLPMKTNTPLNPETQARIQQLKLGVDWHVEQFRVVRMCDGQSPQPAQRFTPATFLACVEKQRTLADQISVVYEAGSGGFHLHRQLSALGVITNERITNLATPPQPHGRKKLEPKWAAAFDLNG